MTTPQQRMGIYGGTFNPVTRAHLKVAEYAIKQLNLDEVWLVVGSVPPHKPEVVPARHRLAMVEIAIQANPKLRASDIELQREGLSYTRDTVAALQAQHPSVTFTLLLGADVIMYIPEHWQDFGELMEQVTIAVIPRAGIDPDAFAALSPTLSQAEIKQLQQAVLPMPLVDGSATHLRANLALGHPDPLLDPKVETYIRKHSLYEINQVASG